MENLTFSDLEIISGYHEVSRIRDDDGTKITFVFNVRISTRKFGNIDSSDFLIWLKKNIDFETDYTFMDITIISYSLEGEYIDCKYSVTEWQLD
jgi:hypothetical protein